MIFPKWLMGRRSENSFYSIINIITFFMLLTFYFRTRTYCQYFLRRVLLGIMIVIEKRNVKKLVRYCSWFVRKVIFFFSFFFEIRKRNTICLMSGYDWNTLVGTQVFADYECYEMMLILLIRDLRPTEVNTDIFNAILSTFLPISRDETMIFKLTVEV